MVNVQDMVDISTAAALMGITLNAVRKRIQRGTLQATKQDGEWYVTIQDVRQNTPGNDPDDKDRLIQVLTEELKARRREVQELHVLLQMSQAETQRAYRPGWRPPR